MGVDESCRARVRVLIPTGFGLNCEEETAQGFRMCGAQVSTIHLSSLLSNPSILEHAHILVMVGGFAFGDHLGAGLTLANRWRQKLWHQLEAFLDRGGLVLGICNGFQTMAKLGLVPALHGQRRQCVSLSSNDLAGYRDGWVRLRVDTTTPCLWTRGIDFLELPSRHAEGKLLAESDACLVQIEEQGLVALRYVDETGAPTQKWPHNPSGSSHAIAGLCDPTGRILGLMPHPDGYLYGIHHPQWPRKKLAGSLSVEGDGLKILRNGVDYAAMQLAELR